MLTVPGVNAAVIDLSTMKKSLIVAMVASFQMVHVNKTYIFVILFVFIYMAEQSKIVTDLFSFFFSL